MRLNHYRLGCFLVLGSLLSFTWIAHNKPDVGVGPGVGALYERLLVAEARGERVSRELSSLVLVLEQMSNLTSRSHSNTSSSTNSTDAAGLRQRRPSTGLLSLQPNAYLYLPHLRQHPDSLNPNVVLGQGRTGVSLVLGIPTVKRPKESYLVNTLSSLLVNLTPSEKNDTVIVVFVAETDVEYINSVAEIIQKNFPKDVSSGLLEVMSCSQYFYPNFSRLRETFGDSKERVKWRTKQNLDYSFLMLYAQGKGDYYVQLEDDIVAKPGYSKTMKAYVTQLTSTDWLFLEFSQLGFIGKMFRTQDLPMIAEFFLMFHKDKPVDWLLDHILWVKACNPEKDATHCSQQKALLKRRYQPSLFQHVGLHSSLSGKVQHLKDKDFGKQPLFSGHTNPPAELSSSMKHYQGHSLERAYKSLDFFWGLTPTAGDYILIHFPNPVTVAGYLFRSGNMETHGDKFYNTTVEVLPSNGAVRDGLVGGQSPRYEASEGGFIVIGSFQNGVAEGQIDAAMQPLSSIRLTVHANSDVWVLLNEIFIKL